MHYLGRKPPFDIVFGDRGQSPPISVSHLSDGQIILVGGRRTSETCAIRQEIAFVDRGLFWENDDLFSKLVKLNADGIPFQFQPKSMDSPDILMAWWQETGKLKDNFREISWRDPRQWLITTIAPPVLGILGWNGPKPFGY